MTVVELRSIFTHLAKTHEVEALYPNAAQKLSANSNGKLYLKWQLIRLETPSH
jgi:hypothetical protein